MAQTTSTVQTDMILAEAIAERRREANYAGVVALQHCSVDSIYGMPTTSKAFPVWGDLGPAAGIAEGTDLSTVTTASLGTQAALTPSEAAAVRFDVTYKAIAKAIGGAADVASIMNSGNMPAIMQVFAEYFVQQDKSVVEKKEVDVNALLDDFSVTSGTTTEALGIDDCLSAILGLTNADTGRESDFVWLFAPNQMNNLRVLFASGAGVGISTAFNANTQDLLAVKPDLARNGLQGALFGIPVYQTATSVNPLPNAAADVAGALLVSGGFRQGTDGALMYLEGAPTRHDWEADKSERHVELFTIADYAVGELRDSYGVSIITDAG